MTNAATIGVVGYHNTGKTTLICKLIERLREQGYSVSTIKNIPKDEFYMDVEGKDTWKHGESGARVVVASTSDETAFIMKTGMPLEDILRITDSMTAPDVILVEGHKTEAIPKIVLGEMPIEGEDDVRRYDPATDDFENLLSYIIETIEVKKVFNRLPGMNCGKCGYGDCMGMAVAIFRGEKAISDCLMQGGFMRATVDGKEIPMGPFVQDIVSKTVFGMVASLKGVDYTTIDADITIEIKHDRR
ncbi:MAG: molybdopterin-guanine dinucleotide biosynthesis protein B [Euryarchaeota archaeon]|nr:MAG: Electron transport complex subunit RsxB [ANME-2 cluster archaeon]MEA1866130.1 molybdopterin-guanine dinucleotide biosynthesis protein B [Euryarchaeota archaeon]